MLFVAHMSDINLRLCQLLSMTVELIIADMGFIKKVPAAQSMVSVYQPEPGWPTVWLKRVRT